VSSERDGCEWWPYRLDGALMPSLGKKISELSTAELVELNSRLGLVSRAMPRNHRPKEPYTK
jgi:hypothetical protein